MMRNGFHKSTSTYVELDAFESDKEMHANFVNGSRLLTEALRTGYGPRRFVWNGNVHSGPVRSMSREIELIREREAYIDTLRVSRDPCPVCGARGDLDCGHWAL